VRYEHLFARLPGMRRCDFCGGRAVKWVYPAQRDWLACSKCHAAIQADDRAALLDRVALIPVPQTVPERYARQYLDRARRLHEEFWETRAGPPRPA
jgi:hypothetical protein